MVKPVNLSDAALAKVTSDDGFVNPWEGCPLDSAEGVVDVCLGEWWETPARRKSTAFTASLFQTTFMLVVGSKTSTGGFDQVFIPFSWALWVRPEAHDPHGCRYA